MPRRKTRSDADVLAVAHSLVHQRGPEGLTFATLAAACGLSASTLVQRFGSKPELVQATLLHAWDRLDERTARLAAEAPRTADGAIGLLAALSRDYGGIEAYAEGLLVLREDLRDPVLRSRGARWKDRLCAALDDCFAEVPHAPPGIGLLMASQWQGSLLWWSFDPRDDVEAYTREGLERLVSAVVGPERALRSRKIDQTSARPFRASDDS